MLLYLLTLGLGLAMLLTTAPFLPSSMVCGVQAVSNSNKFGATAAKYRKLMSRTLSLQHRHGQHAEAHLSRERSRERAVPGHVDQLSESHPDGRRVIRHLRDDEAVPRPRHRYESLVGDWTPAFDKDRNVPSFISLLHRSLRETSSSSDVSPERINLKSIIYNLNARLKRNIYKRHAVFVHDTELGTGAGFSLLL